MRNIETYMMALILSCVSGVCGETATNVTNLGVTEGKSVTNGFVFVDGEYLEPPYIVTRQGAGIYINNRLVEQPCPWPIPAKSKPAIPTEDPKIPASLNEKTSNFDPELTRYLVAKRDYNYYRLGLRGKEFTDAMVKTYSELPFVKEVKVLDPFRIEVTWLGGGKVNERIVPIERKPTEWTRETLLERLEKDRANYEDRLEKGDYYFLGDAVSRTTGTFNGARGLLPSILEILKVSKDAKEVHQKFQQAGYINWGERASEAFFNNRAGWESLERRLEALKRDETGKESGSQSVGK